jgi:hypothetical protein
MCLTNKQMDEAVERMQAEEAFALAHSSDNSSEYVGGRYGYLYVRRILPVPVRPGAIVPTPGRLFPERKGGGHWRPARNGSGIVATLRDESTGTVEEYRIETNGANGVEVVDRA